MMYPWQKNVRKVDPYVPGEQPKTLDVTKLNTNDLRVLQGMGGDASDSV